MRVRLPLLLALTGGLSACGEPAPNAAPEGAPRADAAASSTTVDAASTSGGPDGGDAPDAGHTSVCGDGVVEGDEVCDFISTPPYVVGVPRCSELGDFDSGYVTCEGCLSFGVAACGKCGDGIVGGAEQCDGAVPAELSCESLGYDGGELRCAASCELDLQDCGQGCPADFRDGDPCGTPLMGCPMNECRPCSDGVWTVDRQSFCRCSAASNTWVCDPLDCYFLSCESYDAPNYYVDEACREPLRRPADCR